MIINVTVSQFFFAVPKKAPPPKKILYETLVSMVKV